MEVFQRELFNNGLIQTRNLNQPLFCNKPLLNPVVSHTVWSQHQIDLVEMQKHPVNDGKKVYTHILSVLDVFSRFVVLQPLTSKEPREIVPHLLKTYKQYGPPKSVQSDQGNEFKGEVKQLFDILSIERRLSRPYHPQSQGKVERSHGTWKRKVKYDLLQRTGSNKENWVDNFEIYQNQYTTGYHRSLGKDIMFGRHPNFDLSLLNDESISNLNRSDDDENVCNTYFQNMDADLDDSHVCAVNVNANVDNGVDFEAITDENINIDSGVGLEADTHKNVNVDSGVDFTASTERSNANIDSGDDVVSTCNGDTDFNELLSTQSADPKHYSFRERRGKKWMFDSSCYCYEFSSDEAIEDHGAQDDWEEHIKTIRAKSKIEQTKASEQMVSSHASKKPVSLYNPGDDVLVRNNLSKTRKGKLKLDEVSSFEGKVLERKKNRYRVQYKTPTGGDYTNWFSVKDLTSRSRLEETHRVKEIPAKKKCKIMSQKDGKTNLYVDTEDLNSIRYQILRQRLSQLSLVPVETEGDGNCLFRAVAQMLYVNASLHLHIRQQSVEQINENIEFYQDYFLHEYNSPEEYVSYMEGEGRWADNAIVLAAANAFNIEIKIVSSDSDYIAPISPRNSTPTQTIFLGLVDDHHYLSTANAEEPQVVRYGGITCDGISLEKK